MSQFSQQLLREADALPAELQAEALDFVLFLKQKHQRNADDAINSEKPVGNNLATVLAEGAQKGLFANVIDPVTWQRAIRADRVLPGREE